MAPFSVSVAPPTFGMQSYDDAVLESNRGVRLVLHVFNDRRRGYTAIKYQHIAG